MTKRTWSFTFVTALLILGLAACGGSGGDGGGGGIPSATNAAITPPPTMAVAITTAGGMTSTTNQGIAANANEASDGALTTGKTASAGLAGVQADNSGTQAKRETLREVVRRHAEKLKDHKNSVTGAVQVFTDDCTAGGTSTFAVDDANGSATEVFVNCNESGVVFHGTISSSNVGVSQDLGATVGSPYSVTVAATISIDLSVVVTAPPPDGGSVVTQGSFNFTLAFSGNMVADGTGGVQPGPANRRQLSMNGASLLTSIVTANGTVHELLSNFNLASDDNDTLGRRTVSGFYTYASTMIGGSVTVNISQTQPLVFQPQTADDPSSGTVTITSTGSPGKIVLIASSSGVTVNVHASASGPVTDTVFVTWADVHNNLL